MVADRMWTKEVGLSEWNITLNEYEYHIMNIHMNITLNVKYSHYKSPRLAFISSMLLLLPPTRPNCLQ